MEFIGEIDERQKAVFLGGAKALLFPIDWPEPFGLVMIEALACGTPVIAYDRGSVPEVIEEGVTGFLVKSIDEAVKRVDEVDASTAPKCGATSSGVFPPSAWPATMSRSTSGCWRFRPPRNASSRSTVTKMQLVSDASVGLVRYIRARRRAGLRQSPRKRRHCRTPPRTLKNEDSFAVFDWQWRRGAGPWRQFGMFHRDTRLLSLLFLTIGGAAAPAAVFDGARGQRRPSPST